MTKPQIIQRLLDAGIVAIFRADSSDALVDAVQALYDGGIRAMEVPMTTPNALEVISEVVARYGEDVLMGVGTVLDMETCRSAIAAGSEFVVTPVVRVEVIHLCNRYDKPIVCGAFTPTEALTAHEAGADLIKLFPADTVGPKYVKALLAPLPMLRVIPTGGVSAENAGAFVKAGCVALGAGSQLLSKDILKKRDWKTLTARAKALVAAVREARG